MGWSGSQATIVPPNGEAWKAFSRTNQEALPFLIATLKARLPLRDAFVAKLRPFLPRKIAARLPLRDYPVEPAKSFALSALNMMGPNACEAVPALADALTDQPNRVRAAAANALGKVGPLATNAIPALIRSLKDPDFQVRYVALDSLNRIAPEDERFLAALNASLTDKHNTIRFRAAGLLLDKKRGSPAVFVALAGLLQTPVAGERWHAIQLIRKAGPPASMVVPALIERLNDQDERVRAVAAVALGEIGPLAQKAVPALRASARDEYLMVREAAAEALSRIAPAEGHL